MKFCKRFLSIYFRNSTKRLYSTDRPFSTAIGYYPDGYERAESNDLIGVVDVVKPYQSIPGPKELPIIGNTWRFAPVIGHLKIDELDKVLWSLYKDYGKIVKLGGLVGHPDLLFIFDGDLIEKVFRSEEALPHRPSMPSLYYYKQHLKKHFFGDCPGAVGVHGKIWDKFRRQVQQFVLNPKTARKYMGPLNEIAADFIKRVDNILDENDELPSNFMQELNKWALESVARVSLDTRLGCLQPNLPKDSEPQMIIDSILTFFRNVPEVELRFPVWRIYHNKKFREYVGALENFRRLCVKHIANSIEKQSEAPSPEETLSIVQRILNKTGNPMLATALALDFFLVGVDTTSITVASTMYHLSQNQDKQEILYHELRKNILDDTSEVTTAVQENLVYLKACVKENLRLKPVVLGNGRTLQSDTVISGYEVKKGTHVIFPHLVIGNIDRYFEKPDSFIPERWLKTGGTCPVNQNKIHPFVSLPFGHGRRACLGKRFAEAELHIVLAKIFRKYKVEYNYGKMTYKVTPAYAPINPLKFKLTRRLQ